MFVAIKITLAILAIGLHSIGLYFLIKKIKNNKKNGAKNFLYPIKVKNELDFDAIQSKLDYNLKEIGYKKIERKYKNQKIKTISFWKENNFSINNAFILIEIENQSTIQNIIDFLHDNKKEFGKLIGYIPFINPIGLQIIVIGKTIVNSNLKRNPVDIYNTQTAIIQSVILVDNNTKTIYESTILETTILKKYYDSTLSIIIKNADL
jgi:hypothetical protein